MPKRKRSTNKGKAEAPETSKKAEEQTDNLESSESTNSDNAINTESDASSTPSSSGLNLSSREQKLLALRRQMSKIRKENKEQVKEEELKKRGITLVKGEDGEGGTEGDEGSNNNNSSSNNNSKKKKMSKKKKEKFLLKGTVAIGNDGNKDEDDIVAQRRRALLDCTVDQADYLYQKNNKRRKTDASQSLQSVYNSEASYRSYKKRITAIKHTEEEYEKQKQKAIEMGLDFYPEANSMQHGVVIPTSPEATKRMQNELQQQLVRRNNFSRRRAFNEDDDVDYINRRNQYYNKKLSRAYDKYTVEIKQNLERGTAV